MAPLLLDHHSLFRAGLVLSFGLVLIFFGGYYAGYQKAVQNGDVAMSKTVALALPGPALAASSDYELQVPEVAPGADIDVDSPDATDNNTIVAADSQFDDASDSTGDATIQTIVISSADQDVTPTETQNLATSNSPVSKSGEKQNIESKSAHATTVSDTEESTVIQVETEQTPLQLASLTVTPEVLAVGDEANPTAIITDTADVSNARYTIQVGMYADIINAERRVSELEQQQLSAYIDEYTNRQEKQRFNVRFGYFDTLFSARAALEAFEAKTSATGYVARMRRN